MLYTCINILLYVIPSTDAMRAQPFCSWLLPAVEYRQSTLSFSIRSYFTAISQNKQV